MKIAYIDHSFHKTTKSTDFLFNLLKDKFKVKRFWDYRWQRGKSVSFKLIKDEGFDTLLLFQVFYNPEQLKRKYGFKNIVWVPMADAHGEKPISFFKLFSGFKILAFSSEIYAKSILSEVNTLYVKYFPKPKDKYEDYDFNEKNVFLWYRKEPINIDTINILFKNLKIKTLFLHNHPDPFFKKIKINKNYYFEIVETTWFNSKEDYLNNLRKANIFVAPRVREGIGMSFLDAMKEGLVIVAHSEPTMNEYITHLKTGILFDAFNVKPIERRINFNTIRKNMIKYLINGYERWLKERYKIIDFVVYKKNIYIGNPVKDIEAVSTKTPEVYTALGDYELLYNKNKKKSNFYYKKAIKAKPCIKKALYLIKHLKEKENIVLKNIDININNYNNIASYILSDCKNNDICKKLVEKTIFFMLNKIKKKKISDFMILGQLYMLLNDYKNAEKWLKKAFLETKTYKYKILSAIYLFDITSNKIIKEKIINFLTNKKTLALKNIRKIDKYRIASFLKKIGYIKEAKNIFLKLVKNIKDNKLKAGAYFHLGEIFYLKNDKKNAVKYLKKTLLYIPKHKKAKELIKRYQKAITNNELSL